MDADEARRKELAAFLIGRRGAIQPADVGLPPGPRRRTLGLRREEVAILAGVSPTWYTYLEQGRNIRPSSEVLDSLARVLRLTSDERRYLHMMALGQAPARADNVLPERQQIRELRRVVAAIGHGPFPVYATNWLCDVLAWNEEATVWYTDWTRYPAERRNMLWWLLNEPEAKERVVDWEGETRDVIARCRALSASRRNWARFQALMAELRRVPEFVKWWESHDVHGQHGRVRELVHPVHGVRAFQLAVVYPSDQDENMIVLHPPVDAAPYESGVDGRAS